MEEKEEVQRTIVPIEEIIQEQKKASEDEFFSALKIVAPGTHFRTGLEGALKAGKGALIVVENSPLLPIIDGGFRINCRFTPQRLMELTKMDGAIILSKDLKRIMHANVQLVPDSKIKSSETGTRHKAAERTAKQSGNLTIAISERRHEITLFYKNIKYHLKPAEQILRKANENLQILERHREIFDEQVLKLNKLELRNYPSLNQAFLVIQRGKMMEKIAHDLKKYVVELGNESALIKTRMKEILIGIEKETDLVIKDYTLLDVKKSKFILKDMSYDELIDVNSIAQALNYEEISQKQQIPGWRILSKTTLPEADIAKLIKEKGTLGEAIYSNIKSYFTIIGEEKAKSFKDEIDKIKLNP